MFCTSPLVHTCHRIRSRRSVDSYANFIQADVVVVSNHTTETSPTDQPDSDLTTLQVVFFVILPSGAERAPYRETNYVVPKATLSYIVDQDGEVIQAVVRNSLSPPLTISTKPIPNSWMIVGSTFMAFAIGLLCLVLLFVLRRTFTAIKTK